MSGLMNNVEFSLSKDGIKVAVTGDLTTQEIEGGFCPDRIIVGPHDLAMIIASLFDLHLSGRGSLGDRELGRVKLTIERLEIPDSVSPPK